MKLTKDIPKHIFREYDIRGVYPTDLTEDGSYTIGRAFGSYIRDLGYKDCVVGHDNRLSGEILTNALLKGITASGVDVLYLGLTTTPMYYYASIQEKVPRGIMVTASHNPKEYNGFKIAWSEKGNAKGKEIQDFYEYIMKQNFKEGEGTIKNISVKKEYVEYLTSQIEIKRPLKVIVDCGNGTTTILAHDVFSRPNLEVTYIYDESDPTFPNHHPDPSVDENMLKLGVNVLEKKADIGISFDGDGDRVGVIDNLGRIIRMDVFMALFVRTLKEQFPNPKFLYDIKCGLPLQRELEKNQVEGIMVRSGNSYTKAYTKEYDCILGGEYSGHIYFRDKFLGFDSGIYAGLRILELLSNSNLKLSEMVDQIEKFPSIPEKKIPVKEEHKFIIINNIKEYVEKEGYDCSFIDGIRIKFEDGWALLRASNTGPHLTMRVEATTKERVESLEKELLDLVQRFAPDVN